MRTSKTVLAIGGIMLFASVCYAEEVIMDFNRLPFDGSSYTQTTTTPYQEDGFELRIIGNDVCPPRDTLLTYPTPLSSAYKGSPGISVLYEPVEWGCGQQWGDQSVDVRLAQLNGEPFDLVSLSFAVWTCYGCPERLDFTGRTTDGRTVTAQCSTGDTSLSVCTLGREFRGLTEVSWREFLRAEYVLVDDITFNTGTPPPPAPWISVAPSPADFGQVVVSGDKELTVTISNIGGADLVVSDIAVVDSLAAPFSISGNTCVGYSVPPNDDCTVSVSFEPLASGVYTDSFSISSNDPYEPVIQVWLSAQAVALGGQGHGLDVYEVTCENKTQKQRLKFDVSPEEYGMWDCQAAGLNVTSGDEVTMKLKGTAK